MTKELTVELTDYCPNSCEFCSSNSDPNQTTYLGLEIALKEIGETEAEIIHLSGGEPLAHPEFWKVLQAASEKVGAENVIVHTNAIRQLAFNLHVIPGVKTHGYITPEGVDVLHIAKRIKQGKERKKPEPYFSSNWDSCGDCAECEHRLVNPDGVVGKPCNKKR